MIDTSLVNAARANARVALVTCAELPELEADDQLAIPALAALDIQAEPVVWDDALADWSAYDLVVLRSPWDYVARRDEFLAWAKTVPRLHNSAEVIEWNTDKSYLAELAAAGVPVIPTTFVAPGADWTPPAGDYVVKPAISAGSRDTGRYGPSDADLAIAHLRRLQGEGRLTMVQPYLPAVDTYGETALMFFAANGLKYSHSIRKGPMLTGPYSVVDVLCNAEAITARTPSDAEMAVAAKVVASLPAGLLYARIDLIPDLVAGQPEGNPLVVEVELTEPSVFLEHHPQAARNYAAAIATFLS